MVLHSRKAHALPRENFLRALNLRQVVIGNADAPDLAALDQRRQIRRPPLHVGGIVNPIDVYIVHAEAPEAAFAHFRHRVFPIPGNLRREFRGEDDVLAAAIARQPAQNALRRAHAIDHGGVPQVQPQPHGRVKYGAQVLFVKVIAKDLVAAGRADAPRPCAQRDCRKFLHFPFHIGAPFRCPTLIFPRLP